ncbi:MAG TPA: TetR/AcrR family transcriptional regulator [Myxococcota bacterium]|nr:TetR/AcrR family transcriptional regulator [Myxococcota bacterium]
MPVRISARVSATIDGRALRSERSRHAIVTAFFELIGAGNPQPTAQQVAAQAGVGLRSVFRHFEDMESLYAELNDRVQAAALPLLRDPPATGALEERALAIVRHRSAFFEALSPYKRAGEIVRHRSVFLQRQHAAVVRELRERLLRGLPELAAAPDALLDALEAVLSFEVWERMRRDQRLSRERATEAFRAVALALLADLEVTRRRRRPK